jgi:parvulin-like peptidyl-prolyl isomerase
MRKALKAVAAVLAALVLAGFTGCSGEDPDNPTVIIIGDEEIPLDEFNYFYYNTKADYDKGDESYWTDTSKIGEFYDDVLYILRRNCAIEDMAKQYDIKLSAEIKKDISDYINQMKNSYSDESEYYSTLNAEHMSERMFSELLQLQELWQDLFNYVTDEASGIIFADDEKLLADIPKNFYRATHILIMNDVGDDTAANKALAQQLLERIEGGEDFETLKDEYSEDSRMKGDTDGYYFTHGQMIESFENAVKSLEPGEISGIVESVYGYHIIRRLPLEDAYIYDHLEELRNAYMARIFNEMLQAKADTYDITYTDAYLTLDILPNPDVTED